MSQDTSYIVHIEETGSVNCITFFAQCFHNRSSFYSAMETSKYPASHLAVEGVCLHGLVRLHGLAKRSFSFEENK